VELIDEEGNLFGVVNVVDALVVLLVLAVVAAGAALVLQPEPEGPELATTNVTLDLGAQPTYIVSEINEGDTHNAGRDSQLTITDVYLTPQDSRTRVVVRAQVQGLAEDGVTYANAPLRLGRSLTVATNRYEVSGQIRDVGANDTLVRESTTVVLRDRMAAADASEVAVGDEIRVAGRTVATVDNVTVYATGNPTQRDVFVEATLETYRSQGERRFGGSQLRRGQTVTLAESDYTLNGRVERIGGGLERDSAQVVLRDRMAAADAREIAVGDEIRLAGRTVATVDDVAVYATGNPTQRDVFVEATLETYRLQGERRFGRSPLRRGQAVTLAADDYTLNGRVERVDGGLERDSADVVVEDVVDAETAQRLAEGDTATVAGHDTAEVASVTAYATRNPDRVRVVVGLSLRTLGYGERELFGTAPVQRGRGITVDTGQYTLSGAIERIDTLEPAGTADTRTVTLRMSDVREDMADAIEPGMAERSNGETVARVTAVDTEPSLIITTGQNGSVNVVDHPFNREVTITTELRVRETTIGPRFKGEPLRQGSTVVVDLGTIVIEADVVSVGT